MKCRDHINESLRDCFAPLALRVIDGVKPVRHILLAGARFNEEGRPDLNDRNYCGAAIGALGKADVPVEPAFEVSIVNTDPLFGGEDLLEGGHAADFVVLGAIFNPSTRALRKIKATDGIDRRDYILSPHHHKPGIWPRAVLATGAVGVFVVGGTYTEIGVDHFRHDDRFVWRRDLETSIRVFGPQHMPGNLFLRADYAARLPSYKI